MQAGRLGDVRESGLKRDTGGFAARRRLHDSGGHALGAQKGGGACERQQGAPGQSHGLSLHWIPIHCFAVAVGTIITDRPPHRTVLALLTHTVPTLDQRSEAKASSRTSPSHCWPTRPARCPVRVSTERCSPWPAAFPPRSPSALPGLRSTASSVLCRCSTPCRRTCGPYSSSPSPADPFPCGCG